MTAPCTPLLDAQRLPLATSHGVRAQYSLGQADLQAKALQLCLNLIRY